MILIGDLKEGMLDMFSFYLFDVSKTVLHGAAIEGKNKLIGYLIELGANIEGIIKKCFFGGFFDFFFVS